MVPKPHIKIRDPQSLIGVIFFGTSTHATYEAISRLAKSGLTINSMRVRAFPFQDEVIEFIDHHEKIFVIEQNRDAQLRTMLMAENDVSPKKMQSVLYFEGMPITADFITERIRALLDKGPLIDAKGAKGEKS
jgi:2-oxoglutarate ferredoxin oxidoreductase subunit alpha